MGNEILSNISNSGPIVKRSLYFSQISNKSLIKKRSFSKELTNPKEKYFKDNSKYDDKNNDNLLKEMIINKNNNSSNNLEHILEKNKNAKILNIINNFEDKNDKLPLNTQRFSSKQIRWKKEEIKQNTIFIFDWDDTLFFTTHLDPIKNNLLFNETPKEKRMMKSILIITNSSEGWVESCTHTYYSDLIPLLKKIKIISARSLYEKKYPSNPLEWKIKAFNDLKERFNFENCPSTNIICIGDDNSEIIAAKKLSKNFDSCIIKTIKLRESPQLKELIKQLILVDEQILRIASYPKSLTIQVGKMKNPKKI